MVQLRVFTKAACLPSEVLNFFLNTEELLKSALLFSSFLWNLLAFYPAQIKNQQMPQEKKSRWRGDAPPSLGYLGLSGSGCLGSPELQFFISLAPWRKLCWFFCLLIAAFSLCQESTNVWSPGCLGNLPMPSYRFFFFLNQAFLVILSRSFGLLQSVPS